MLQYRVARNHLYNIVDVVKNQLANSETSAIIEAFWNEKQMSENRNL